MSADRLLASGLTYSSAFPGFDSLSLVAWWTFVSGYSCGTATDLHRVPGPVVPCPPTSTDFVGAQKSAAFLRIFGQKALAFTNSCSFLPISARFCDHPRIILTIDAAKLYKNFPRLSEQLSVVFRCISN